VMAKAIPINNRLIPESPEQRDRVREPVENNGSQLEEMIKWRANEMKKNAVDTGLGAVNSFPSLIRVIGDMTGNETPTSDTIDKFLKSKSYNSGKGSFQVGEFFGTGLGGLAAHTMSRAAPKAIGIGRRMIDDNLISGDTVNAAKKWINDPVRIAKNRARNQRHRDYYTEHHDPDAGLVGWFNRTFPGKKAQPKLEINTRGATDNLNKIDHNDNLITWAGDHTLNHGWRGDSVVHEAFDGMKNRTSVHNLMGTYVSRSKDVANGYAKRQVKKRGGEPFNQELLFKTKKILDWDDPLHALNTATRKDAYNFGFDDDRIGRVFGTNNPRITFTDLSKFSENKFISTQGMRKSGFDGISFAKDENLLLFNNNSMKAIDNPGKWSLTDDRLLKSGTGLGAALLIEDSIKKEQ